MKKLLLSAGLLASGAVLTISEYFFKYAMTPFNKKVIQKILLVKIHFMSKKPGSIILISRFGI